MAWQLLVSVVLLSATFCVCEEEEPLPWWRTCTFYQVYPRSFKDSDGDGMGDLRGITQKATYFKEIGVDAIWMSPINTSPMVDFGYDISDFKDIDPLFGTLKDFEDLIRTYHELDIKVLVDFVPNHTSDEHPWFEMSTDKENHPDYADFYVWKDAKYVNGERVPPNNWLSLFGGSAWSWNEKRKQYYLHIFTKDQPDLNFENPNVRGNMTEVMRFWLDKGVDGFRIDAVKEIFHDQKYRDNPWLDNVDPETPPHEAMNYLYEMNQPENNVLLEYWAEFVNSYVKKDGRQRALFLELYHEVEIVTKYYGKPGHEFMFPFNFRLIETLDRNVRPETIKFEVEKWMKNMPKGGNIAWVVSNHDRPRVPNSYGFEMVDAITMLTGVLPGVKCVYYGEEIGMDDTFIRYEDTRDPRVNFYGQKKYLKYSRDPSRTPMQWDNSDPSAGFSTTSNTWLPINPNYYKINAESQLEEPRSHLKIFQTINAVRKDPILQRGDLRVEIPLKDTLVIIRSYMGEHYIMILNTATNLQMYTSKNVFEPLGLDKKMYVVTSSIHFDGDPGLTFKKGKIRLWVRPHAAVLLRTGSPKTNKLWVAVPLIIGLPVALTAVAVLLM